MNKAMAQLSETVGEDVPTFEEIREKIEGRYAKAKGMSELTETSVESRMLEVEQASMNTEAQARLAADPLPARPGSSSHRGARGGTRPSRPRSAAPAPTRERRLTRIANRAPVDSWMLRHSRRRPRRVRAPATAISARCSAADARGSTRRAAGYCSGAGRAGRHGRSTSPAHAAVPRVRRRPRGAPACGTARRRTRARRAAPAMRCPGRPAGCPVDPPRVGAPAWESPSRRAAQQPQLGRASRTNPMQPGVERGTDHRRSGPTSPSGCTTKRADHRRGGAEAPAQHVCDEIGQHLAVDHCCRLDDRSTGRHAGDRPDARAVERMDRRPAHDGVLGAAAPSRWHREVRH